MNSKLLPPHYFAISIGLMLGLHFLAPWGSVSIIADGLLGTLLLVGGLGLVLYCARLFRSAETPIKPRHTPTQLVDSGPFNYSRNPIYLGGISALIGFALLLGSFSPWVIVVVFALLIHHAFVLPEEEFLRESLGDEYRAYCERVRRWL